MDSKTIRKFNLLRLKKQVGTWPQVAEPAQTNWRYLSQIASNKISANLGDELARRLEEAHNKPHGWMDMPPSGIETDTGGVPIVGTVRAGPDRHYLELEYPTGHGDGRVGYNSKDESAYAVRVEGDSMSPRIRPGEYVVASPAAVVRPGDDVVISTVSGQKMVKQFLFEREGQITVDSINSTYERLTIRKSDVEAMHKIVAITASGTREAD
jgi:phage repressor protein C with HTH and peptisase S24 domain